LEKLWQGYLFKTSIDYDIASYYDVAITCHYDITITNVR